MSRYKNYPHSSLLPFNVIEAAASGDVDAINKVLKHYEVYIKALSTKRLFDEDGNTLYFVDEDMCRTLETNLIVRIMQFDVNRAA